MTRLTISEKIILNLSRYEMLCEEEFNIPWDLTQDGVAAALGITRAHSSIELKKLKDGGRVDEHHSHVKGCKMKRKWYSLTPLGMDDAKRLRTIAEEEGLNIMPVLDMRRCDPQTLWDSVADDERDALGTACVFRCSVNVKDLPGTVKIIPADPDGMTLISAAAKELILSTADADSVKMWHSAAADHWLDRDDVQERLYHLVRAGRMRDAYRLIISEKERLLYNINDDLSDILSELTDIPERYLLDVVPVMITVALGSDDVDRAEMMIGELMIRDKDIALLYSADVEMKRGDHAKALSIIRSIEATDRCEVGIRAAGALGHLGRTEEAMDLLNSVKGRITSFGTVEDLDRVYIQMAEVCTASGDIDSSIKHLTKALGVAGEEGKKKIYGLLAASYETAGMKEKAKEYSARSAKASCPS